MTTVAVTSSPVLRIRAVARRHAFVLWRSPHRFFDIVFWPVIDVLMWGALGVFVTSEDPGAGRAGATYLLAGIVLFHVLFQSHISVATGFMEETWSRNLLNLMVTPVREVEYAAGVALFGLGKLVMAMGVVTMTAVVFFSFDAWSLGWGTLPIAALLLVSGWTVSLFVIGLVLRFGQSAEIIAWAIVFLMLAVSGVFYPVEALPGVFEPLAHALPTTHAFEAARDVLDGRPLPWDELAVGAAGCVALGVAGVAFVTAMLAVFRRRGYVTRFS
jgi:ABC-2 type transport system permease protein